MAKQYKDKLATLKAIATGSQPFEILRQPTSYVIVKHIERGITTYEYNGTEMNEREYEQWYTKNVREDMDSVLHFIEIVDYSDDEVPERSTHTLEIHQEPIRPQERPVAEVKHIVVEDEPSRAIETAIDSQLRPYGDHVRFNERMYNNLFS